MISRAAGVILLVLGGSSFVSWSWFEPSPATGGWTSYSPLVTNALNDALTQLHDSYYVVSATTLISLPNVVQALAGIIMIVFSRSIGRLLARGLNDEQGDAGSSQ